MEKTDGNRDVNAMLSQSCGTKGVGMMKSTMKHPIAGLRCLARIKLEKRSLDGDCSRLLHGRQHNEILAERALSETVNDYQTYFAHISEIAKEC